MTHAPPRPAPTVLDVDGLRLEGVVDCTHCPDDPARFPDAAAQVAGFALHAADGRLAFLRWVPAGGRYVNAWDAATGTLGFHVPERSRPFLRDALTAAVRDRVAVPVLVLVGCQRYDLGDLVATAYADGLLTLVRPPSAARDAQISPPDAEVVAEAPVAADAAVADAEAALPTAATPPTPPRLPPGMDSLLEDAYRRLLAAWGVSAGHRAVMYHLDLPEPHGVAYYTPDGHLYDLLADDALAWCGPANRHGRNAVLEIKPVYPAQDVFQKLRALATLFHTPVLLVYGRPDIAPTEERMQYGRLGYHRGPMAILFRPGDGATRRVHFDVRAAADGGGEPRVCVVCGEPGEFGPLHPRVLAGHAAIAAAPTAPLGLTK